MEIVRCDRTNLASVLMGKGVDLPWRGQRNVCITIPEDEWFQFIREHHAMLTNRQPLRYENILNEDVPSRVYKFFMFECTWAFYNEILISENYGRDCTLILPEFLDGESVDYNTIVHRASMMSADEFNKNFKSLQIAKPSNVHLYHSNLTEWNWCNLQLCVYLHSLTFQPEQKRLNVEVT